MGFVSRAQLVPELAVVVADLEPDEISEIIETADGFTAVYCAGVRPAMKFSFDDVKSGIERQLKKRRFNASLDDLDRRVLRRMRPMISAETAEFGSDDDIVLRVRTSGRTTSVSRLAYLYWASNQGPRDPSMWSRAAHEASLRELALVIGTADEALRLGLTRGGFFLERNKWELENTAASCVMDYESLRLVEPPTNIEVEAIYRENRDNLVEPEKRDLDILRVEIGPPDPAAQYRALERHSRNVASGAANLKKVSHELEGEGHDVSLESLRGASPRRINKLGRSAATAVMGAAEGATIGPIQEAHQLILVRIVAIQPSRQLTLEEATPRIRRSLERSRQREARRSIAVEIVDKQNITIY